MTVAMSPFCLDAWSVRIHQALAPIDILQSMLADEDTVSFLKPRLKGISYLSNTAAWCLNDSASDEYLRGEMDIARDVYMRQMVVLAATYTQLIVTDFFRHVFLAQPDRMHQVLPPDNKKFAQVPLADVVQTGSREELLSTLADQAASIIGAGEPDKIMKRLLAECNIKTKLSLVEDLKSLKELRNRIVHDDTNEKITFEQIHSMFGLLLALLYVLSLVADKYGLACWDETGFVHEFEEKLKNRCT
ncbi:hypothetical protein [Thalassoroseus pseudoceratinae]|uniref:hypothetical protein n=1 Tax=Thalassoroseus pseudoceratinae TaxID=2713176 RepID=UPI0014204D64|nr:hypothetical protein [Thalassoroseus pseudoceratinae]